MVHTQQRWPSEREHRLLSFAPAAGPADAPKQELTPELRKEVKEIKEKLKDVNNAVKEAMDKIDEAMKDGTEAHTKTIDSLKTTAKAYFDALTADGKKPEAAVLEVQDVFGKSLHCTLDADEHLKVEEHADLRTKTEERLKQEGFDADEAKDLADALKALPPSVQRWFQRHAEKLTPETRNEFQTTLETMKGISKDDLREGAKVGRQLASGQKLDLRKTTDKVRELMGTDQGREVLVILGQCEQEAKTEDDKQLSVEEKEQIMQQASKILEKFDPDKATQDQKDMIMARLQMAGVDPEQSDLNAKPPKIVPMEGSRFDRSINRFSGILSYITLTYEKIRGKVDKAVNKGKDEKKDTNPDGTKKTDTAPADGKVMDDKELEDKVRGTSFGQVSTDINTKKEAAQKKLNGDPANPDPDAKKGLITRKAEMQGEVDKQQNKTTEAKQKLDKLKPGDAGYDAAKTTYETEAHKLTDLQAKLQKLTTDVTTANEEIKGLDQQSQKLTEGKKKIDDLRKDLTKKIADSRAALGNPPTNGSPDAQAMLQYLNALTIVMEPDNNEKFRVTMTNTGGDEAKAKEVLVKFGVDASAFDMDGNAIKNPAAFRDAVAKVTEKIQAQTKQSKDAKDALTQKGASPEDAESALFLQQKYGLKFELRDTVWTLTDGADKGATITNLVRAFVNDKPQMKGAVLDAGTRYMQEQFKDVTTSSGSVALAQGLSQIHGGNWADPKLHTQLVNLVRDGKVPNNFEFNPERPSIAIPSPTDEQKEAIKTDATLFPSLVPALKQRWFP